MLRLPEIFIVAESAIEDRSALVSMPDIFHSRFPNVRSDPIYAVPDAPSQSTMPLLLVLRFPTNCSVFDASVNQFELALKSSFPDCEFTSLKYRS